MQKESRNDILKQDKSTKEKGRKMSLETIDFELGVARYNRLKGIEEKAILALLKSLKPGELIDKKLDRLLRKLRTRRRGRCRADSEVIVRRLGKIFGSDFRKLAKTCSLRFLNRKTRSGSHNLTRGGD